MYENLGGTLHHQYIVNTKKLTADMHMQIKTFKGPKAIEV